MLFSGTVSENALVCMALDAIHIKVSTEMLTLPPPYSDKTVFCPPPPPLLDEVLTLCVRVRTCYQELITPLTLDATVYG